MLPYIQSTTNNSPNVITDLSLNKLCYGFKVQNAISILLVSDSDLSEDTFHQLRLAKREETDDAIIFASIIMKARYNAKHLALNLKEENSIFLRLHYGYSISGLTNRKLSQQRIGPFKILAKVGQLAYKLELPPIMRIHPVISIAQLEPAATTAGPDPYKRSINSEPLSVRTEDELQ